MKKRHYQSGFTLIEISIVLIIIGLLAGGILVGRDLIKAAEIRATIAQAEKFATAANTFKNKYNCLPGDCPNASAFGFDATSNGNGDGRIGVCNTYSPQQLCSFNLAASTAFAHESVDFWYHLSAANLIAASVRPYSQSGVDPAGLSVAPPPGVVTPDAPLRAQLSPNLDNGPGGWWIENELYFYDAFGFSSVGPLTGSVWSHSFLLTPRVINRERFGGATSFFGIGGFLPRDIHAIDQKMDDGLPGAGGVRGWNGITTPPATPTNVLYGPATGSCNAVVPTCSCSASGSAPFGYNLRYTGTAGGALCNFSIKAPF